jgi:hypothetical protein
MFNQTFSLRSRELLDEEIERTLASLRILKNDTEEYATYLSTLERLMELKKGTTKPSSVSPDVRATIAANLMGIFMIIKHEQFNVIGSKALGFVMRVR